MLKPETKNNLIAVFIFVFLFAIGFPLSYAASTITAASCSSTDVQNAINQAQVGDTVRVPAGTCSWSGGLSITGISLVGAGKSSSGTVITAGGVTMTKHATQYTRVSSFRFTGSDRHVTVGGSSSNKPYIIDNNYFFTSGGSDGSTMLGITVNGGLLHHNDFTASSGTNADVFNIITSENWAQAPTFGTDDTTGERNIYIEDNTFTNILETAPDGDVGGRFVIRYNTYVDSSIVFHGGQPTDSSPGGGTRQIEVYNNIFDRVSNSAAINKWIWVRGSSGVIANNNMERADSPDGSSYPNKNEILLTVGCPTSYPVQYQVGQSNQNPENPPSHPLLIFGNTGAGTTDGNFLVVAGSDTAGPPCSTPNNYIRNNRDYYLSNQWNWRPYTYPHPLTLGYIPIDTTPPTISNGQPSGTLSLGTSSTAMTVTTNENANCKYSTTANVAYLSMTNTFTTTGGTTHSTLLTGLTNGNSYTRYVKCQDTSGNANANDYVIYFSVSSAAIPTVTLNANPSSIQQGQSSTLTWSSTNTQSCTATNGWSGSKAISGSQSVSPAQTTTFTLSCTGSGGLATQSVTVAVGNIGGPPTLPEGNSGIAAQFPSDANIQSHPDVIFTDNFESYTSASQLTSKWDNYYQGGYTRIATETGNVYAGSKALEFSLPQVNFEVSNAVVKNINPTQDTLFVRVYTKFESGYHVTTGSNHDGIRISAKYPGPGSRPNGNDFFLFMIQNTMSYNEADPGYSNLYVYHPEQRSQWGDEWFPDGRVVPFDATPGDFGPYFIARPNFVPQLDRWYSYEIMVNANTPGQRDGRAAFWIDGKLMADFQNVRVRDISTLKIDQIQLELHAQASSPTRVNKKWYDNLVVARSYIGPMSGAFVDTTPPTLSNGQPTGTLPSGSTSTTMSVTTNENANCKFSTTANVAYSSMTNTFSTTGGTTHSTLLTGLVNGQTYTRYVKCQDSSGNTNTNDYPIMFSVLNAAFDFSLSNGASKTITQGQSTTNTITSTLLSGTTQSVSFSATGLPTGATSSFSPTSCNPTCTTTLSINTINSIPLGNYTINVNGIGGGLTRTTNFRLTINPIIVNSCSWDFFPGDIPDGKVTLGDVIVVVNNFGTSLLSPGFNAKMDFNNNNQIDLFDVLTVLAHFGSC